MRRALQLSGISDRAGRDRLDAAASALPFEGALDHGSVDVSGARNDDGVLALTIRGDGVTPAELFNAVLRHGNDEVQLLIEAMDQVIPPARSSLLTGGWASMASVQRARGAVLPGLIVSDRDQDTAYGAAVLATGLLDHVDASAHVQALSSATSRPDGATTSSVRSDLDESEKAMNELTTLERRGMAAISTAAGRMLIVAADQRNGMKAVKSDRA